MAFGTALAALAFYIVGYRAWRIARQHNYITPPELIGKTHSSTTLEMLYLIVMVVFTLPYLALQPIGAGHLLANLTDGQIPYFRGATLLTAFIVLYAYLGGMRTAAWTLGFLPVIPVVALSAAIIAFSSWLAPRPLPLPIAQTPGPRH